MSASPAKLSSLDSERFGIVVARADSVVAEAVPDLLAFSEENDVELLIVRCDAADTAVAKALATAGMVALEAQITYRGPLRPDLRLIEARRGTAADREAVEALAGKGFAEFVGHYHADPRLDEGACREVYVDWAVRGLEGEAADVFLLTEDEEGPTAFGMFSLRGEEVVFLLSAVAERARGRGLYSGLIEHGMAWGGDRGAEAIIGITPHGNVAPQRNLIKVGLLPTASTTTFHGWRDQMSLRRSPAEG